MRPHPDAATVADPPEVHVGIVLAHAPQADVGALLAFARDVAAQAQARLQEVGGAVWSFDVLEPTRLSDDDPRRPSDFLDEATLRMAEGPYDMVVALTDVALVSARNVVVPGLASRVTRVAVMSTRRLLLAPRDRPPRRLDAPDVRANGATLLLRLVGRLAGLGRVRGSSGEDDPFAPFVYREERREAPRVPEATAARMRRLAPTAVEEQVDRSHPLAVVAFYVRSVATHPADLLLPLLRNRAPLLSLALPSLVTAALLPVFILVFTAEIWDVGLNMGRLVPWGFAAAGILSATFYLTFVQNLFFPRKEKRVITPHLAVANVVVFVSILLMVVGLFALVAALILAIELWVFPQGLISTWPTLEDPEVTALDKVRLAVFVSTLGVLTGSLGGGLESRAVIRHLALFPNEP